MTVTQNLNKTVMDGIRAAPTPITVANPAISQTEIVDLPKLRAIETLTKRTTGIINPEELTLARGGTGNRTLTVTSTSNKIKSYYDGIYNETVCPDSTITIENIAETTYVYVNSSGVLTAVQSGDLPYIYFQYTTPLLCTIYYNATDVCIIPAYKSTHVSFYDQIQGYVPNGGRWESGLAMTFTSSTFAMTAGYFFTPNFRNYVTAKTTCFYTWWEYGKWNFSTVKTSPVYNLTYVQWNNSTVRQQCTKDYYTAHYYYLTNCADYPILAVLGQREDATLEAARLNNVPENLNYLANNPLLLGAKLLYRVIWKATETNATYVEALDYRNIGYANKADVADVADVPKLRAIHTNTKEPTGITNAASLGFTTSGRTLTVTSSDSNLIKGYYQGVYFEHTCPDSTITVANVANQTTFVYIDSNNVLQKITPAEFTSYDQPFTLPLLCAIYYNGVECMTSYEYHGTKLDADTHAVLHQTVGCRWEYGLTLTADNKSLAVTQGAIWDEDIRRLITPQTTVRHYYRTGSTWLRTAANNTIFYTSGGNLQYDNAGSLSPVGANDYVAYWLFGTFDKDAPLVCILGQRTDTTLANARANNTFSSLTLGTLPSPEMKLLYRIICRNDATPYEEISDFRATGTITGTTLVTTSHGSLSGLGNDDHPQYLLRTDYLSTDIVAALAAANAPTALNPLATIADIGTTPDYITVNKITDTSFDISAVTDRTKYVGDTRPAAGHTWINYWSTGSTPASLGAILASFTGSGSGYATITKTDTNELTLTASVANPDFDTAGASVGESLYVCTVDTGVPNYNTYEIASKAANVVTFTTNPYSGGVGSSITIRPTVALSNSALAMTIAATQDIYFKGIRLNNFNGGSPILIYGKLTLENCMLDYPGVGLQVMPGGSLTFIGYNNTITLVTNPIKVLRGGTVTGQVTVIGTTYSDPGSFKDAGIKFHTGSSGVIPNFRCLWTAFGLLCENGSQVIAENLLSINSYRDGVVSRGGHIYAPNAGLKKITSGYCGYNEYGTVYLPNNVMVNGGGSTSTGCYTATTDVE